MAEAKAKTATRREASVRKARSPKPGPGTDIEREEQAALRAQAFELRLQGHSQKAIGEMLGRDHSTISRWIDVEIDAMISPRVEALREQESARLDRMLTKLEPKIERGDVNAINAALRVSERRARLMGLDAPVKVEHTSSLSIGQIDAEIERLTRELAQMTGQTPEQITAELDAQDAKRRAVDGEVVAEQVSPAALPWSPAPSDVLAGIDAPPAAAGTPGASGETLTAPASNASWPGGDPWVGQS